MKLLRNLTLVALPVLTLFLGMQIGIAHERQQLQMEYDTLEEAFGGGVGSGATVSDPEKEVDISLLWSVWRLLSKNYIAPSDLQVTPMIHGAVRGLVEAVGDPYTSFMPPKENKEFRQSLNGSLQGIGAELTMKEDDIVVVAPLKGSPAEAAGLMPDDIITHVDGQSIEGYTLSDAVEIIRGPKGTEVTLTISRDGREDDITITREEITVPSVESEVKEYAGKDIGYIALNRFGDTTTEEVASAVKDLMKQDIQGLIFDVRFNGGGYFDKAVDLSSMFLEKGKVVSVAHREGEPIHHYASGRPIAPTIPMVVLINEGSASASEILAGALQDNGRATIIGKKSFGKGTVQEVFELPGGTSIRITTARWLTPNGTDLGKEGVHPDIDVDRTKEDIEAEKDPQLDAALELLSK
ncbi:S41 family peptidase [Candidatus Peribacteria bacterium]|nr:S41 family peptidase [Candidatus Peribacteria bacterium]